MIRNGENEESTVAIAGHRPRGARGNPANFTITYSTSVFYELTAKQYE